MTKEVEEGRLYAFLGVFLPLVGFLLVLLVKKKNKYAMYYAKQGLVIFIAYVVIEILKQIPFIGVMIWVIGGIALLILWIIGLVYSLSDKKQEIPLIGELARKIRF
jgi:uncharacterized membrane protein